MFFGGIKLFSLMEITTIRLDFLCEAKRLTEKEVVGRQKKDKEDVICFGQKRRNFKFMHHIEYLSVYVYGGVRQFSFILSVHSF